MQLTNDEEQKWEKPSESNKSLKEETANSVEVEVSDDEQIEEAKQSEKVNNCSIFLCQISEEDLAILKPCDHFYCIDCIRLQESQSIKNRASNLEKCPMCRQKIEEIHQADKVRRYSEI